MKRRWIIVVVGAAAVALGALLLWRRGDAEQRAVEETRGALRQQGFKTDLSDFDFSTSDELRARAAALIKSDPAGTNFRSPTYGWRTVRVPTEEPNLMATVGADAALVVWKRDKLISYSPAYAPMPENAPGGDLWPALREALAESREDLDAACAAALSGPIRFNPVASQGSGMLLPHVAAVKGLAQILSARGVLELHDGNRDAAWTNLLASTRAVTAWEPEPVEVSQMVRCACTTVAFNITWQVLQAGGWSDDRLAGLQQEWESVDFFKGLPETAAFARACYVATCQLERRQPLNAMGLTAQQALRSPQGVWYGLNDYWRRLRYRNHGSYEDEKALLLHYRDREVELRRAVQAPSWLEMRQLPGVTNAVPFRSRYYSSMQAMMNSRQIAFSYTGRGHGPLGRAAEAEARRRLIVTAIALDRYRGRHGSYPATLQALVPELLPKPPTDFMDGKPLRYRLTSDGHFVLYSVGLDCEDNGGRMQGSKRRRDSFEEGPPFGVPQHADLVWPRPASAAETELQLQAERKAEVKRSRRAQETRADYYWARTAKRQAKAQAILQAPPQPLTNQPTYRGRPLSEVLRSRATSGTNNLTLTEMLTLKQVSTGAEPEIATFELPITYDVLTNLGSLHLYIDFTGATDADSDEGFEAAQSDCNRATNGNCLLVWNTIYEAPGIHALQAGLALEEGEKSDDDGKPVVPLGPDGLPFSHTISSEELSGPLTPFVVSNLCQFSLSSAYFDPRLGGDFLAKLPESNGTYRLEVKLPTGEHLKTFSGSTSNGVIKVHWDLTDDHGRLCTNDSYDSVFQVTLPDSGRSQTMRGP